LEKVHHIDYDKKNCDPENLITLCKNCHPKTNSNRGDWIEFFAKIILLRKSPLINGESPEEDNSQQGESQLQRLSEETA